ncbi:hypothetical protein [Legionella sp. WA2022007384]
MSLSKLNIQHIVEQKTSDYIFSHLTDYSGLRNPCILASPVRAVIEEVNNQLSEMLSLAKKESASKLILDACNKQKQQDLMEKEKDEHEKRADWLVSTQLKGNLQFINEEVVKNEHEIEKEHEYIQQLQLHLKRVEEQITINNQKKEEATHHHSHAETEASTTHNHTHPETSKQYHRTEHSHPDEKKHEATIHTHQETVSPLQTTHSHPNTIQHGSQATDLEFEKKELIQKISSLQIGLESKKLHYQQQLEQQKKINKQLFELPQKEQQRMERAHTRETRERARLTSDPTLLQLSQKNRDSMEAAIKLTHQNLTQEKEKLMQEANEISYQIYLYKLEALLFSTIKLNYSEYQALTQIVQIMKAYLVTKAEENAKKAILDDKRSYKSRLEEQMRDNEKNVEQFKKSNPELVSSNLTLAATNKQLEISVQNSQKTRNNLAKAGLFSLLFTGGAAGTGLAIEGGIVVLTSLVLAPAAVLAVITLSLFIAALVYAIKASVENNQLDKNKKTMEENRDKIDQQTSKIISLEDTVIPDLKGKISTAEKELRELNRDYLNLKQKADLQREQARRVAVIYPSEQRFTNLLPPQVTNSDAYQVSIQPTAPSMEEFTGQPFTYN